MQKKSGSVIDKIPQWQQFSFHIHGGQILFWGSVGYTHTVDPRRRLDPVNFSMKTQPLEKNGVPRGDQPLYIYTGPAVVYASIL